MKVTTKNLEKSLVEVSGELPASEFDVHIAHVTQEFVANAELDGFRKGKAPEKLVVQRVGEDKLLQEAAEHALQEEWPKILEENHIEAVGPAQFHIIKIARGNDLIWKATVAVMPEATLPDYKKIASEINKTKEAPQTEIPEKEIEDTLAYIAKVRTPEGGQAPEINDEFAKSLGDFENLESLKTNIKENLKLEKEGKAREAHQGKLLEAVAKELKIELPQVMIEYEKDKMLREFQANMEDMGLKWNDYLAHIKKTEQEIREGWQEDAVKRIRIGISLSEIAKKENIQVPEEEITKRTERILKPYTEEERKQIDEARVREYAHNTIRNEKVVDLLESIK